MESDIKIKNSLRLPFDKILFSIASVYLMAVIFWLVSQGRLRLFGVNHLSEPVTTQNSLEEQAFIAYLERSLSVIEQKPQKLALKQPNPAVNPSPNNSPSQPQIIERIYVPIYEQNQASANNNQIQTAPSPVPPLSIPPVATPAAVPSPPKLSTVPVLSPTNSTNQVAAAPVNVTSPVGNHSLVGLLEAGSQSSAIFTANGSAKRVALGEKIGATGWILKAIQNQQAVISRNGQQLTLEVGQGF